MVTVSQKEFQRVKVIENAVAGRLSVGEAARLLQLSERQVQRLKRRYRPDDVAWVHHGNRGRPMPWALPAALRRTILQLARGKYQDFNDSHLCQKLRSEENLVVSRETVRRILRRAQLASPQKRRWSPVVRTMVNSKVPLAKRWSQHAERTLPQKLPPLLRFDAASPALASAPIAPCFATCWKSLRHSSILATLRLFHRHQRGLRRRDLSLHFLQALASLADLSL
jgi:transposase